MKECSISAEVVATVASQINCFPSKTTDFTTWSKAAGLFLGPGAVRDLDLKHTFQPRTEMLSHTLTVGTFSLVFYRGQAGAGRQLCVQQLRLSAGQQDGQEARSTMKTSAAASCHLLTENNQMQQRKPEKRKHLHE